MAAAIFDFNGTTIFDGPLHDKAWNAFVKAHCGRTITPEEFKTAVYGINFEVVLSYFLGYTPAAHEVSEFEEEREGYYRELCKQHAEMIKPLAPGLVRFLDELKRLAIPINIATASPLANMEFFFDLLELDRWFSLDTIVYNDHSFPSKPAPDIYLKSAQKIGVPIDSCTIFEDAPSGLQGAYRSGAAHVVAVASEFDRGFLKAIEGVELVIDDYKNTALLLDLICS